ncbi:hypothetical protein AMECASPLE_038053 [Ameca splendens]|uniref:Uncharacterized protein n=1 Tax=Ameca splendens TaxID=208324 RepID=A0ABV0YWG7_9TELE
MSNYSKKKKTMLPLKCYPEWTLSAAVDTSLNACLNRNVSSPPPFPAIQCFTALKDDAHTLRFVSSVISTECFFLKTSPVKHFGYTLHCLTLGGLLRVYIWINDVLFVDAC